MVYVSSSFSFRSSKFSIINGCMWQWYFHVSDQVKECKENLDSIITRYIGKLSQGSLFIRLVCFLSSSIPFYLFYLWLSNIRIPKLVKEGKERWEALLELESGERYKWGMLNFFFPSLLKKEKPNYFSLSETGNMIANTVFLLIFLLPNIPWYY